MVLARKLERDVVVEIVEITAGSGAGSGLAADPHAAVASTHNKRRPPETRWPSPTL